MSHRYFQKKAEIFKAICEPTRLMILELLKNGERCVSEIHRALDQNQPNVSKHLNLMKRAGIVDSRKEGLRTVYWIKHPDVLELLQHAHALLQREFDEDITVLRTV